MAKQVIQFKAGVTPSRIIVARGADYKRAFDPKDAPFAIDPNNAEMEQDIFGNLAKSHPSLEIVDEGTPAPEVVKVQSLAPPPPPLEVAPILKPSK